MVLTFGAFKNWREIEYFITFRGANREDVKRIKQQYEAWKLNGEKETT